MRTNRRGLLGSIAGTIAAVFMPRVPTVVWEEPDEASDIPPLDEDEEEESSDDEPSSGS